MRDSFIYFYKKFKQIQAYLVRHQTCLWQILPAACSRSLRLLCSERPIWHLIHMKAKVAGGSGGC